MARAELGIALVCAGWVVVASEAAAQDVDGQRKDVLQRIGKLENQFRKRPSFDESPQENEVTVRALMAIVHRDKGGANASGLATWAIGQLGNYPDSQEGVRFLVERIDYEVSLVGFDASPIWTFPAAKALVKAGVASRNEIFLALRKTQSDRRLHLMAYVLTELDSSGREHGSAAPVTVFRLARELERVQADPEGPRNPLSEELKKRQAINSENLRRMIGMLLEPGFEHRRIAAATAAERNRDDAPVVKGAEE